MNGLHKRLVAFRVATKLDYSGHHGHRLRNEEKLCLIPT